MIDRNCVRTEDFVCFSKVIWRPDAGDFTRNLEQGGSDGTGCHIDFINIGGSNQKFGVFCAGAAQHGRTRGHALNYS